MSYFCDLLGGCQSCISMTFGGGEGGWRCCIPMTSGRSTDVIFL